MSNLLKRVVTGIALIALVLSMIFINRVFFLIGIILFSNTAIYEMLNALSKMNYGTRHVSAYIFNTIFIISAEYYDFAFIFPLFTIYIFSLFVYIVLDESFNFNEMLTNTFVSLYITLPYTYLVLLNDPKWVLFAFALPAFTDTFAYFVGMFIGKNKLIERLSPKKTIEGAIGGLVGALIFTFIFTTYFNLDHRFIMYFAAIIFSMVSQIGDLFASYIKRTAKIKDYGTVLVGHGGIMDRFDSLLLVAPLIYILVNFLR